MRGLPHILGLATASFIVIAGSLLIISVFFHDRVLPGVTLVGQPIGGLSKGNISEVVAQAQRRLQDQVITIQVRNSSVKRTLGELGVKINEEATSHQIATLSLRQLGRSRSLAVAPVITVDEAQLTNVVTEDFHQVIKAPRNASLKIGAANQLSVVSAAPGEGPNIPKVLAVLQQRVQQQAWTTPVPIELQTVAPLVQDTETQAAQAFATQLLKNGLVLHYQDQSWPVKPFTISRLLQFTPAPDPQNSHNQILGVSLEVAGLEDYLTKTIVPEIDRPAQNARFERADSGQVTQFAVSQTGLALDIPVTMTTINQQLAAFKTEADVAVNVTEPAVASVDNIQALGITTLLASGYSDFKGSPANRIHNIEVGTARFQGVLIAPGEDFSFDKALGPVDADHDFKPELVIKSNVTTPEFGGGLCQVSTTAFRAAVYSGLKITARRNHAYAVKYYGTPGFDSTIYPPYTDLRFTNNTPGYILIQTKIEGTRLTFDFWGTPDDRQVVVDGPHEYDRHPDGSVKATLKQTVTKDGAVLVDDTFYSRYKSPSLFPHVTAGDPPAAAAPPASPAPSTPT